MTMSHVPFLNKISRLATGIMVCLALSCVAGAQTKAEKTADANAPGQAKANAIPQTPELKEAEELGTRVIKLFADGKYDEALRLAKRVLDIREKALGPEHPLVDEALYNLAEIYIARNNYKEAETFYQRLLARYEKVYGPEHIKTAPMIQALGYLAYRREDLVHAETLLLRARAIFEKTLGAVSEKVASLTLELADIYRVKRDLIKAEATYLRAVELSELLKEPQRPDTMSIADKANDGYECFLYETIGINEAQTILARLYESRKKTRGDENSGVIDGYLNGRALVLPKPPYPTYAIKYGVSGTVIVRVRIDESGGVVQAWAVCGPPYLREVAVKAARKARFSPTSFKGKPIVVTGVINYHFGLYGR